MSGKQKPTEKDAGEITRKLNQKTRPEDDPKRPEYDQAPSWGVEVTEK